MHNAQLLTPSATLVPLKQGDNSDAQGEQNSIFLPNFQRPSVFNSQLSTFYRQRLKDRWFNFQFS